MRGRERVARTRNEWRAWRAASGSNRGVGLGNPARLELPAPTVALPGTQAKLRALEARAAAGLALWHPGDALPELDEDKP